MFLLLKLLLLLGLAYILLNLYLYYRRSKYRDFPSPPVAFSFTWFTGHLPDLKARSSRSPNKNFGQLMAEYHKDYHWDMLRLSFFKANFVFCVDLRIVPKIMTDHVNFPKSSVMIDAMSRINRAVGQQVFRGKYNLLGLPGGDLWRAKRRILDPAFKKIFLRNIMGSMNKVARDLVDVLENKTEGAVFDIMLDLNRSAMLAISICGFDWDDKLIEEQGQDAIKMANLFVDILAVAIKQPFEFSLPWNNKALKERYKNVALDVKHATKVHLEKRMKSENNEDILSQIIKANECSEVLDMEDLLEEYTIFLAAGMETTAITMATVVQFLTNNPEQCQKVQEEVDEVFEGKENLVHGDIIKLKYLDCVIKETLRMKGPAFGTMRVCKNDNVVVEGVHFPKETAVYVSFEVMQNDARYWEEPSVFNPDRFSGDSGKNIGGFTYMPFSAGPRNCIGKNFALLEMKVFLANVIRKFNFVNPNPGVKDPPRMGAFTVRPLDGVPVKIYSR